VWYSRLVLRLSHFATMASASCLVPAIGDEKPLSPEEIAKLEVWRNERRAEKAALKVRVREIVKELKKMPEWQIMKELKAAADGARDAMWGLSETIESWVAEAEREYDEIYEEMEEYRETKYLPALRAHPLGPEYIAARKRLEELKLY
jgi:hypothetical protein